MPQVSKPTVRNRLLCRLNNIPPTTNVHLALRTEFLKEAVGGARACGDPGARAQRLALRLDHAHALSAQLQPRMPPVRCPHRSALPSLVNRFCSRSARCSQVAWTAAPQLVREVAAHIMRRPSAPAAAPPRPLQPPQPLALPPLIAGRKR